MTEAVIRTHMADETANQAEIGRTEVAERLRTLAAEFDGEDAIDVQVGNKTITLAPSPQVTYEIETSERDPTVRSAKQRVTLDVTWEPDKDE
jgi:amphi-Trp domain-containing protein